jgi:hypothetical protein
MATFGLNRSTTNPLFLSHTPKIIGWRPVNGEGERERSVANIGDLKTSSSYLSLSLPPPPLSLLLKSDTKRVINYLPLSPSL